MTEKKYDIFFWKDSLYFLYTYSFYTDGFYFISTSTNVNSI